MGILQATLGNLGIQIGVRDPWRNEDIPLLWVGNNCKQLNKNTVMAIVERANIISYK